LEAQTSQLDGMLTANQELKNLLHFNDKETGELMESHSATMQQLVTDLSHLQDKLNEKTSELDQSAAENRELVQRLGERDEEMYQCNNNIATLKQEIEGLRNELEKQSEDLKRNADELANLSSVHESDVIALRESQEQLSALRKELDEKCAVEVESHRKSCELKDRLHDVHGELDSERLLSEKLRSESEALTAAVCDKDEQLSSLTDQLRGMDDKVKNYEIVISELQQQLEESSARLLSFESEHAELTLCRQQLAEAQSKLEQKDRELTELKIQNIELSTPLVTSNKVLGPTDTDTETEPVQFTQSGDRNVTTASAFAQTSELINTSDEMAELSKLNRQLLDELTTVRNRLADLEVENCMLRNTSQKPDALSINNYSSEGDSMTVSSEVHRHGDDESVGGSTDFPACRLSELSPSKVDPVTERIQGKPASLELSASDELLSLKEKYSQLESSHARLKEELLEERENSSRFVSIESLKQSENESNLAQIEALTATKKKMLTKLKELKASNDSLVSQVEDLTRQLETKSAELSNTTSETQRLTGCLSVLEDEKKNWLSAEGELKVTVSRLREELVTAERKHEDEMKKRLADVQSAAEVEKCGLQQQMDLVRDELRSKIVDYESQLTTLKSEKNHLETSLEQANSDFAGREGELKQKLADLQTLHNALMSDTESYQQLLEQVTADNTRLEELLRTRSGTVEELRDEIRTLRVELAEAESQKNEFETKCHGLAEQQSLHEESAENAEQVKSELDSTLKENAALMEEVDGLNWKIQGLSEIEEELSQLQSEMFDVQSENGMLKKRLSVVEREASERSGTDEDFRCAVEKLEQEKQKLMDDVEQLESEVKSLRAELDAKSSVIESKDLEFRCIEEKLMNTESEREKLMERYLTLEAEKTSLRGSGERRSQPEETSDHRPLSIADDSHRRGSDDMAMHLQIELDELRQRNLVVESDNSRLQSVIEGMKAENEQLRQKVAVGPRAKSQRPRSTQTVRWQQGSDETTSPTYQQPVNISLYIF